MTADVHPLRAAKVRVFNEIGGTDCIAIFGDGRTFPILFTAPSAETVREKAEAWRTAQLAGYEAKFLARRAALEKARAARAAKVDGAEDAAAVIRAKMGGLA